MKRPAGFGNRGLPEKQPAVWHQSTHLVQIPDSVCPICRKSSNRKTRQLVASRSGSFLVQSRKTDRIRRPRHGVLPLQDHRAETACKLRRSLAP